jgi:tetratricopeptide (TPR) repeat protein
MMNAEHSRRDDALGLLLAGDDHAEGMDAARALLLQDRAFRDEFESLQRVGVSVGDLGEVLHRHAGTVDLLDDVFDSIAHMAFEDLGAAKASPYGEVERELRSMRKTLDAQIPQVSLLGDIMAAVAASRKSDAEVERPFATVALALNGLGSTLNSMAPEVALVEPVMDQVARTHTQERVVTPFRARPAVSEARMVSRRRASWPAMVGWAAAASVCALSGWMYFTGQPGQTPDSARIASLPSPDSNVGFLDNNGELARVRPFGTDGASGPERAIEVTPQDTPKSRVKEPITLQDAINARRSELLSQNNDFALLASLTGDEASELLKSMDLSVEALLGAAQFLSTDEAIAVLRAAIAEHPDDPQLKYALAMNLEGNPQAVEERMQQLAQLATADSDNGLPHYMLAADYFEQGEMARALEALGKGASYGDASAYTLESANQREAALVASGLDVDTARFLALSTAGSGEYSDISALRNELLDFGAHYEQLGEYDTAEQIYNAVNELGEQLVEGASMAVEQQFGLETQQDAILAIQGIAEVFQQPETVALLGETLGFLAESIVDVTQYIAARQDLVINSASSDQLDWSAFLNHVMNSGDLNVSGFIR